MPHRSKRKYEQVNKNKNRTRYIVIAAIVALVVVAGGVYAYTRPPASSISCPTVTNTNTSNIIYVCIKTNFGSMTAELFPASAPKTVANFVSLVKSGFYDNLVWHRIVPNFVIQTGDPNTKNGGGDRTKWGTGNSSHTVPLEIDPALHNDFGSLGMARGASNASGSSQFYINLGPNTSLDGKYTVFGKVVDGMSFANEIVGVLTNANSQPVDPTQATLISITILSGA